MPKGITRSMNFIRNEVYNQWAVYRTVTLYPLPAGKRESKSLLRLLGVQRGGVENSREVQMQAVAAMVERLLGA